MLRYIRAFEVGRDPRVPKYECHIKFRTTKDGATVRGTIKLPHAVQTNFKIAVFVDPSSKQAELARAAGAVAVGEDELFELVKSGKFEFDRCLATPDSLAKLQKAGLPRILGPRGLMPSEKLGTVTNNVSGAMGRILGASTYRERQGVIRMAIGRLGFSPEQLRDNMQAFVAKVKGEAATLNEQAGLTKLMDEIVLSSTQSPGFSLNGNFRSENSPSTVALTG